MFAYQATTLAVNYFHLYVFETVNSKVYIFGTLEYKYFIFYDFRTPNTTHTHIYIHSTCTHLPVYFKVKFTNFKGCKGHHHFRKIYFSLE